MMYVESKIDGVRYCVSNGEFSRHLAKHGLSRRDYYVRYIGEIKYCLVCGSESRFEESKWEYRTTCGKRSCSGKQRWLTCSDETKENMSLKQKERWEERDSFTRSSIVEKRKNTCQKKYGVEHPMMTEMVRQRVVDTNMEKYGSNTPLLNSNVQEKIRATMLENYGVEHPMQSDAIKHKLQQTNKDRYGVSCTLMDGLTKEKIARTNFERYGNEISQRSDTVKQRISDSNRDAWERNGDNILAKFKETNLEKYGVDNPSKMDVFRKKVRHTLLANRSNYDRTILTDEQISALSDVDAVGKMYEDGGIAKICESFSIGESTAYRYLRRSGYQILKSSFETEVFSYISVLYAGEILCNNKKIVNGFEADIFVPEKRIVFECNGTFWHSEEAGRGKYYHHDKSKAFANVGIKVFHIWEHQWNTNKDVVKSWLQHLLGKSTSIPARKCEYRVLSSKDAKNFLEENHRQGSCVASFNIALTFADEVVALMTFGKPRYNKKYQYELLRFASKNGCHIVGGASKLLSWFVKNHSPKNIISYSDRMMNEGGVYAILGMKHIGDSEPCFHYTKNYRDVFHRSVFQKHKLKGLLGSYDDTLTAHENMVNNGYGRIWDCGTSVFVRNFEDSENV